MFYSWNHMEDRSDFSVIWNVPRTFTNREELKKLGAIVQNRLHHIQNPISCQNRRKLNCLVHVCGLGCQVNTIAMCLMIAYALNRTAVITPPLTTLLESPSSTCKDAQGVNSTDFANDHERFQVVQFHRLGNTYKPKFYPPAVPEDLFYHIRLYHDNPFLWWTGQISKYLFRLTRATLDKWIQDEYNEEFQQPIVGIHVRRTDKVGSEAKLHKVHEYMELADRWFNSSPGYKPKIFLATDEPRVLTEIVQRYPHFKVITNTNFTMAANVRRRTSEYGTAGIIHDIYWLSRCDYVVCTFTSNVCRLVAQLINAERGNVSRNVISVDRPTWYFSGARKAKGINKGISVKMPYYP